MTVTDIQVQLHQADSPSVEPCQLNSILHFA